MTDEGNRLAQGCALLMAANGTITHTPPSTWVCYTAEGAEHREQVELVGRRRHLVGGRVHDRSRQPYDDRSPPLDPLEHAGQRRVWLRRPLLVPVPTLASAAGRRQGLGRLASAWADTDSGDGHALTSIDSTGWTVQSDTIPLASAQVAVTSGGCPAGHGDPARRRLRLHPCDALQPHGLDDRGRADVQRESQRDLDADRIRRRSHRLPVAREPLCPDSRGPYDRALCSIGRLWSTPGSGKSRGLFSPALSEKCDRRRAQGDAPGHRTAGLLAARAVRLIVDLGGVLGAPASQRRLASEHEDRTKEHDRRFNAGSANVCLIRDHHRHHYGHLLAFEAFVSHQGLFGPTRSGAVGSH